MNNLRPNTIRDIRRMTDRINCGKFDRRLIGLLLVKLRGLYKPDSRLHDIADYVAHDYRNQGETYKLAKALMDNVRGFIKPNVNGGHFLQSHASSEIITQEEVCTELFSILKDFGAEMQKFTKQHFRIMHCILENIEEAVMYVSQKNKPYLRECRVSQIITTDEGVQYLTFSTRVVGNSDDGMIKMDGASVARLFLQAVPIGVKPHSLGLEISVSGMQG